MLITAQFREPTLRSDDFFSQIEKLFPITVAMDKQASNPVGWYAQGDSLEEASLYPVFDAHAPSTAILAVLKHRYEKDATVTHIAIWNGAQERSEGISVSIQVGSGFFPNSLDVETMDDAFFGSVEKVTAVAEVIIDVLRPQYVSVQPRAYATRKVFNDKPGVGWMLYLPQVITAQQVPEAQALIPVPVAGKKQTGTIIVSVAEEVFSLDNPSHVELANHIEMRLVDQDLLPRYADL
ncbi:Imm52 family immunity protein [Achromobacter denitrificans]|uniref:Imm52 family immunity protein n=1 Tax=Achromobacter denitrificans TaxID=32002 RepID=A0ABZ3FTV4_ACHDE